jgi:hypothetical protein
MPKSSFRNVFLMLAALGSHAVAQEAPSSETLVLSLKTLSKALAGCRETYTWARPRAASPLLKSIVGADGYYKTMVSLDGAEKFTKFLIEHPDQIKGGMLVIILSTSDDFSVGVGSTRTEILASLVREDSRVTSKMAEDLSATGLNLSACQKSLFNAGDDYVGLVLQYINTEDLLVGASKPR